MEKETLTDTHTQWKDFWWAAGEKTNFAQKNKNKLKTLIVFVCFLYLRLFPELLGSNKRLNINYQDSDG